MNVLHYLLYQFCLDEKMTLAFLIAMSLVLTFLSTNFISSLTAGIIQSVQTNNFAGVLSNYKWYMGTSFAFLVLLYVYKFIQNRLLTKMTHWLKQELLKIILTANNENLQNVNFIEFITPITRIPGSCYILLYDVVTVIIPTMSFLVGIGGYFCLKDRSLGAMFFAGNLILFFYLYLFWEDLCAEKSLLEVKVNDNEKIIVDILNNVDKVIYRGQVDSEIASFEQKTSEAIDMGLDFHAFSTNHIMIMNALILIVICVMLWQMIRLQRAKVVDTASFIALFTILVSYRERMMTLVGNISDYLEFVGKLNYIVDQFDLMLGTKDDLADIMSREYKQVKLPFDKISFDDVSFRYSDAHPYVFEHLSLDVHCEGKIIGITGLSGKGKSSFVKLLLRLYDPTAGKIFIDDVDITSIDPDYIRENITYVNQNSKMFDKRVIENLFYGCSDPEQCSENLNRIFSYAKIKTLYKNIDIENKMAGSLGENLSGGQRQIANVISGLVNPSSILILDEPTNALDPDLKEELLNIIADFRDFKKCIFIITHDRDVYSLFDETIKI